MSKTQISTSVPPITKQQVDELVEAGYGTISNILTIAIDRLHQSVVSGSDAEKLRQGLPAPCAECSKMIDPSKTWWSGSFGAVYCDDCIEEWRKNQ